MNEIVKNIGWFFGLVVFQIFILDAIDLGLFSTFFSPMIFSFFILRLKLETNVIRILIYSFLMGMTIDVFRDTIGLNTAALLVVGITRSYYLSIISARDDFESTLYLNFFTLGLVRFSLYFGLSIMTHHLMFFLLEEFSFVNFFSLLFKSFVNTAFALLILVFLQYLLIQKK